MAEQPVPVRFFRLMLVASIVTLLLTVARTLGEMFQWHAKWFQTDAGGVGSPFGIVWLVPLFGFLFGRRAAHMGSRPPFLAAFAVPLAGATAVVGAAAWITAQVQGAELQQWMTRVAYAAPAVALLALFVWPRMFFVTLAYGVLARAPVAVVQWLDLRNGWGTHYGKVHPKLPADLTSDAKLHLLTLAQFGLWVPFTILVGTACAALGAATVRRGD
ncbi:MAG: hypothetical protein ACK6DT_18180 [Planctomycetota bacterium]